MRRTRILIVVAGGVLVAAILARVGGAQAPTLPPDEHFKYASVGIEDEEGIPYWIWKAMPVVCADKLPSPADGYGSFGILSEPGRELPVGFSKRRLFGGERVAINCAFCHVAAVRTEAGAPRRLFLGAPSNVVSPQDYARFLQACAAAPEFNAGNVLSAIEKVGGRLSFTERLTHRFLFVPAVRRGLKRQQEANQWMDPNPPWGPGRIDPFNRAKFVMLQLPVDGTIGNSDMMPIWNMRSRKTPALHWDGLLQSSVREAALSSALGDGATPESINLESLTRVEEWMMQVPPPPYPYPIDQALAKAGGAIYDAQCAQCHTPGGARAGTVIPLTEVGTDRHRLDMWTPVAVTAYSAFADEYPWDLKGFKKTDGYVAVPLDGLWIRAPYLHNGSVPYLEALFEPVAQRPALFYRGSEIYDPVRVGFVSEGPEIERRGFKYDTSVAGNGNAGHLWGTELAPEQKRALVEFLKTM
jgi:mono/diheme cytochrome c family protein